MDHDRAIESRAAERYLLGELSPESREAFEEHYFSCPACAADLCAAAEFAAAAREALSGQPVVAEHRPWLPFAWLRPLVTVPALASLLLIVAYQNLIYVPHLKEAAAPRLLEMHSLVAADTRGEGLVFSVARGEPFGLYVDVPADARHASYLLRLEDPAGRSSELRSLGAEEAARTQVVIVNPGRQAGRYALVVCGSPASGGPCEELARLHFTVELQN